MKKTILVFCITFLIPLPHLFAFSDGMMFNATEGCGCHAPKANDNTLIELIKGKSTAKVNEAMSFEIVVTHPSFARSGITITLQDKDGRIAGFAKPLAGEGLKVLELNPKQLVHEAPKSFPQSGERKIHWRFEWVAPPKPGEYTLLAVANAVNLIPGVSIEGHWQYMKPLLITVSNQTSAVEEHSTEAFLLYPNPAHGRATIELPQNEETTLRITDMKGNTLLDTLAQGRYIWEARSKEGYALPAGSYIVAILSDKRRTVQILHLVR